MAIPECKHEGCYKEVLFKSDFCWEHIPDKEEYKREILQPGTGGRINFAGANLLHRCIPWYKNEDCIVCQEHCPTPQKAIELKQEKVIHFDGSERLVKRPYVREDLCIGCGICETKCPIEGKSAIIVTPQGEQRWSD